MLFWLRAAKKDLERAARALDEDDRVSTVFWSQQAAEKALKAVLLATKGVFPRTHNIRRLFEELGSNLGLDEETLEEAYALTKWYHVARYPDIAGGVPDELISRREAEEAFRAARAVVRAAEDALEELAKGGRGGWRRGSKRGGLGLMKCSSLGASRVATLGLIATSTL